MKKRYMPPSIRLSNLQVEAGWLKAELESVDDFIREARKFAEGSRVAVTCGQVGLARSYAKNAASMARVALDYLERAEKRFW
jgi:hypothetical protein